MGFFFEHIINNTDGFDGGIMELQFLRISDVQSIVSIKTMLQQKLIKILKKSLSDKMYNDFLAPIKHDLLSIEDHAKSLQKEWFETLYEIESDEPFTIKSPVDTWFHGDKLSSEKPPIAEFTKDFDKTQGLSIRFSTLPKVQESYEKQMQIILASDNALTKEAGEELPDLPLIKNIQSKTYQSDRADWSDRYDFEVLNKVNWNSDAYRPVQLINSDKSLKKPRDNYLKTSLAEQECVDEVYSDMKLPYVSIKSVNQAIIDGRNTGDNWRIRPLDFDLSDKKWQEETHARAKEMLRFVLAVVNNKPISVPVVIQKPVYEIASKIPMRHKEFIEQCLSEDQNLDAAILSKDYKCRTWQKVWSLANKTHQELKDEWVATFKEHGQFLGMKAAQYAYMVCGGDIDGTPPTMQEVEQTVDELFDSYFPKKKLTLKMLRDEFVRPMQQEAYDKFLDARQKAESYKLDTATTNQGYNIEWLIDMKSSDIKNLELTDERDIAFRDALFYWNDLPAYETESIDEDDDEPIDNLDDAEPDYFEFMSLESDEKPHKAHDQDAWTYSSCGGTINLFKYNDADMALFRAVKSAKSAKVVQRFKKLKVHKDFRFVKDPTDELEKARVKYAWQVWQQMQDICDAKLMALNK